MYDVCSTFPDINVKIPDNCRIEKMPNSILNICRCLVSTSILNKSYDVNVYHLNVACTNVGDDNWAM